MSHDLMEVRRLLETETERLRSEGDIYGAKVLEAFGAAMNDKGLWPLTPAEGEKLKQLARR